MQEYKGRFNLNGSDLPYAALWGKVSYCSTSYFTCALHAP